MNDDRPTTVCAECPPGPWQWRQGGYGLQLEAVGSEPGLVLRAGPPLLTRDPAGSGDVPLDPAGQVAQLLRAAPTLADLLEDLAGNCAELLRVLDQLARGEQLRRTMLGPPAPGDDSAEAPRPVGGPGRPLVLARRPVLTADRLKRTTRDAAAEDRRQLEAARDELLRRIDELLQLAALPVELLPGACHA